MRSKFGLTASHQCMKTLKVHEDFSSTTFNALTIFGSGSRYLEILRGLAAGVFLQGGTSTSSAVRVVGGGLN